jgi:hypothetical protein
MISPPSPSGAHALMAIASRALLRLRMSSLTPSDIGSMWIDFVHGCTMNHAVKDQVLEKHCTLIHIDPQYCTLHT